MDRLQRITDTPPGEYLRLHEKSGECNITEMWNQAKTDGLIPSSSSSDGVLDQIIDIFDVAVSHGICSLVLDAFQEISSDELMKHCGTTTVECVFQWMQHCLAYCQEQMGMLTQVLDGGCDVEDTLEPSLRKAILLSDSVCKVSEYVLSWQNMEKSIHFQQHGQEMSGPLSQNMIQNFKDLKIESEKYCIVFKSILCVLVAVGDGEIWRCGQYQSSEEWRKALANSSLLSEILDKYYGVEKDVYARDSIIEAIISIVLEYRTDVPLHVLLSLVTYCVLDCGATGLENWKNVLHVYFHTESSQVYIWSIALYLDRAFHDEDSLKQAENLWNMDMETQSMLPVTFLDKMVSLGHAEKALSLLPSISINSENISDVVGLIRVLLANNMLVECFFGVREHLEQLSLTSSESQCKEATRMFWNEICECSSKYGLLFQMIKLPISIESEEKVVVEWLDNAHQGRKSSQFLKVLCLYFIARGRVDEARSYYNRMSIDMEDQWDSYLRQLIELSSHFGVEQEAGEESSPFFMLEGEHWIKSGSRDHAEPNIASNILFKPTADSKQKEIFQPGPFQALQATTRKPARDLLRHSAKARSGKSETHTLDKLLEM